MLFLIFILNISIVNADKIEKDNIFIDPYEDESEFLMFAKKDEKIEGKVTSDIPVNIYILTSDNYYSSSTNKDYSKAVYSRESVTSQSFSYKITDDQTYYLIISTHIIH